jgi:drug/metabolite transporter (DMT)-like permease
MNYKIDKEEKKVILAYIAVCIIWGSTYLAIRIGVSAFPPILFAGARFVIAGLLMIGYVRLKGQEFPNNFTDVKRISIVGLFLLLGGNGLVVWAEQWVHSGVASVLIATVPLWMAILEMFLPEGSSIGTIGWIGLLMGFGGVVLLVTMSSGTGAIDFKGCAILLLSAFLWAVGSVYSKRFNPTGSMFSHIGIQMLAGGIALSLLGLSLGEASRIHLSLKGLGALAYLIFFGSLLGYGSYMYVLQKWPAAKAGTYAYINPPVAVLLGAIILREPLTIYVVISTAIILGGVLLVQTSKKKFSSINRDEAAYSE